jgi:hypothetical protein
MVDTIVWGYNNWLCYMLKIASALCFLVAIRNLVASDGDDGFSLHPKVCVLSKSTPHLNKAFEELTDNSTITSLTFSVCLSSFDVASIAKVISTMSALKVLNFVDEHEKNLACILPELPKTVRVFVGVSYPELSLRRVWNYH